MVQMPSSPSCCKIKSPSRLIADGDFAQFYPLGIRPDRHQQARLKLELFLIGDGVVKF